MESGDLAGGLDFLIEHFRENRNFHLFFEAQLMKKRLELGVPLIQQESIFRISAGNAGGVRKGMIEAARETGTLALAAGEIARAWPYFRAIGEPGPVAEAIEQTEPGESAAPLIDIAFREGVHPAKGLQFILKRTGCARPSRRSVCMP